MHLILGTAQLGLNYGITNTNLKPSLSQALSILNKAYNNKIYMFDTAQAYGDSESKLGIFNRNKSHDRSPHIRIMPHIHTQVRNNAVRRCSYGSTMEVKLRILQMQ